MTPRTPFPYAPVLDALNRVENPLSNGGKWTNTWQNGTSGLRSDGASAFSASSYGSASWNAQSFGPAQHEVYVQSPAAGDSYLAMCIPAGQLSASLVNGYVCNWNPSVGGTIVLSSYVSNSATNLNSVNVGTITSNDQIGMRIDGNGLIRVFFNGTEVMNASDYTYTTGYFGLITAQTAAIGFRNFGGGLSTPVLPGLGEKPYIPKLNTWLQTLGVYADGQFDLGSNLDLAWVGGSALSTVLPITGGGGTLRSIGAPAFGVGARLMIANLSSSRITVLQNAAGGSGVKFQVRGGVNLVLPAGDSAEFLYTGAWWQQISGGASIPTAVSGQFLKSGNFSPFWAPLADVPTVSPPISGLWQNIWPSVGTTSGSAYAVGTTFAWRVNIPYAFNNMLWQANSITAGSTFRVGIYADTATGPGALLVQTADLASSVSTVQTAALAWTGGMCWIAVQQVGSTNGPFNSFQGISPWTPGISQPSSLGANISAWAAAGQGSVMPNPFPTSGIVKGQSASPLPAIYLQAV